MGKDLIVANEHLPVCDLKEICEMNVVTCEE